MIEILGNGKNRLVVLSDVISVLSQTIKVQCDVPGQFIVLGEIYFRLASMSRLLLIFDLVGFIVLVLCMQVSQSVDVDCIGSKGEPVVCFHL